MSWPRILELSGELRCLPARQKNSYFKCNQHKMIDPVAHILHYLLCPKSTRLPLPLRQENCPSGQVLIIERLEPQLYELHLIFSCFSLPGVSLAHFTAHYLPKVSKNWRNRGCVNAVVGNLRRCSRSNVWILEAWEP